MVLLAIALYLASLAMPALSTAQYLEYGSARSNCLDLHAASYQQCMEQASEPEGSPTFYSGFSVLLNGWGALFVGNFGWSGNLAFAIAFVLAILKKYREGFQIALLAVACALEGVLWRVVGTDEGGVTEYRINHFFIGFYVWLIAIIVLLVYCYAMRRITVYSPKPNR